jgi:5-methylcytosine-specific restriction endonuclease McrA
VLIDGKKRNLHSRKYCLNCSPYGYHNTRKIDVQDNLTQEERRRKQLRESVKKRRKDIKEMSVAYKGSSCCVCGYSACIGALEFHHVFPEDKLFAISKKGATRSWNSVKEELDKCILVCSNCHREIECGIIPPERVNELYDEQRYISAEI